MNGEELQIFRGQPLEALFDDSDPLTTAGRHWRLTTLSTSESRGYLGTWELKNNALYLVDNLFLMKSGSPICSLLPLIIKFRQVE